MADMLYRRLGRWSAAYALTGSDAPLRGRRGQIETAHDGGAVLVTWHPSYILRLDDPAAATARAELCNDLAAAAEVIRSNPAPAPPETAPSGA